MSLIHTNFSKFSKIHLIAEIELHATVQKKKLSHTYIMTILNFVLNFTGDDNVCRGLLHMRANKASIGMASTEVAARVSYFPFKRVELSHKTAPFTYTGDSR